MYLEKMRLDGRVAVVTGAGQGIGAACARALGEAGATVILADRDAAGLARASAGLSGPAHTIEVDIVGIGMLRNKVVGERE